ncbi:hypothetical protein [Actinophytocola sp.]|uniref:PIN-like domain-containing protein n=1 Tax=Actinophytocola sp. TaxID=1872138 RepID=UPI0039C88655
MTGRPRVPDLDKVRFFVDEDLAGVGLGLMRLRNDVVTGSHEPVKDLIPRKDEEWIPEVARRGWVVITADRHIRTRLCEASAALANQLRCACLRPPARDASRWDFVRLLAAHWDAVEQLCARTNAGWLEVKMLRTRHRDYQAGRPLRLPPG